MCAGVRPPIITCLDIFLHCRRYRLAVDCASHVRLSCVGIISLNPCAYEGYQGRYLGKKQDCRWARCCCMVD